MYKIKAFDRNTNQWCVIGEVSSYPTAEKLMIAAVTAGFIEVYYDKIKEEVATPVPNASNIELPD